MGSVVDRLKGRKATHTVDDLRPVDKSDAQMPHSGSLEAFNQNTESPPEEVTKESLNQNGNLSTSAGTLHS
jgi:hypothetical protein